MNNESVDFKMRTGKDYEQEDDEETCPEQNMVATGETKDTNGDETSSLNNRRRDQEQGDGVSVSISTLFKGDDTTTASVATGSHAADTNSNKLPIKKPANGWRIVDDRTQEQQQARRKRWIRGGAAMLLLLMGAVVVIVLVFIGDKDDDKKEISGNNSNSPDPSIPLPNSYFSNPEQVEWVLQQDIRDDRPGSGTNFAFDVQLSDDGAWLYVGTRLRDYGFLYLYNATIGKHVLHTRLSIDNFLATDSAVTHASMSGNGKHLAIRTEDNTVTTYDYDADKDKWTQHDQLLQGTASQYERYGESFDFDYHGNVLAIGAPRFDFPASHAGQISIFERTKAQSFSLAAQINGWKVSDLVGMEVNLSADGTRVTSGNPIKEFVGVVWVWERSNLMLKQDVDSNSDGLDDWELLGEPIKGEVQGYNFGNGIQFSATGNVVAVQTTRSSQRSLLDVYEFVQGEWRQRGDTIEQQSQHKNCCISADGNFIVFGLHPYQYDGKRNAWIPMKPLPFVDPHDDEGPLVRLGSVHCSADGRTVVKAHKGDTLRDLDSSQIASVQVFRAVEA